MMMVVSQEPSIFFYVTVESGGGEKSNKSQKSPLLWPSGTNRFWDLFSTFIRKHATPHPFSDMPKIIIVDNQNLLCDDLIAQRSHLALQVAHGFRV